MQKGGLFMDFGGFFTVGAGALAGAMAGFIAGGIMGWFRMMQIDSLEARFKRLSNDLMSQDGVVSRHAQTERMSAAVAEVAAAIQAGKKPEDALKEVAVKYPDVAAKILQKAAGKGFLKGFGL